MSLVVEEWNGVAVNLPSKRSTRRDWRRAFQALDKLLEDGEDTQQAFVIVEALSGPSLRESLLKLLGSDDGREVFKSRIELAERFNDLNWLQKLPEGSFGRAYYDFVSAEGLSAAGLVEESLKVEGSRIDETQNDFAWYSRRIRDLHDFWHVLTGYGRDGLGELSLLAFTYSQTKSLGALFIAYMGARSSRRHTGEKGVMDVIWQAKRDGKAAAFLPSMDLIDCLPLPLDEVRRKYGVATPQKYQELLPKYLAKVEALQAA